MGKVENGVQTLYYGLATIFMLGGVAIGDEPPVAFLPWGSWSVTPKNAVSTRRTVPKWL
jgi:hypothetical protein